MRLPGSSARKGGNLPKGVIAGDQRHRHEPTADLVIAIMTPTIVRDIRGPSFYTRAAMLFAIGSILGGTSTDVVPLEVFTVGGRYPMGLEHCLWPRAILSVQNTRYCEDMVFFLYVFNSNLGSYGTKELFLRILMRRQGRRERGIKRCLQ